MAKRSAVTTDEMRLRLQSKILANAETVVDALLEIIQNQKAPAPARATACTTYLRTGGLLDQKESPDNKQLHELTMAELDAMIAAAERKQQRLAAGILDDGGAAGDASVFD